MEGLHIGDAREFAALLPPQSVQTIVTSPPYWGLRSYLPADDPAKALEMGSEPTPDAYVANLVALFAALRPALRDDGTLWLNLGDSYANNASTSTIPRNEQGNGSGAFQIPAEHQMQARRAEPNRLTPLKRAGYKHKDLVGIPWLVAFALRADDWYLRSDIVWHKPNPMPESVRDRPTRAHEYLFLLTKRPTYYYDQDAIREPFADERMGNPGGGGHYTVGSGRDDHGALATGGWLKGAESGGRNKRDVWTVATQPFSGWGETSRLVPVARDAAAGDTKRITSPDCPVHGGRRRSVATPGYGGRGGDATSRIAHTDDHRALGQVPDSVPTDRLSAPDSAACSSGSPRPECASSATDHSNASHKTDHARWTLLPDTPSAGSLAHTEHTSASLVSDDSRRRTSESNARAAVGWDGLPLGRSSRRTVDTSSSAIPPECTCQFYQEITEKASHYATMPPELVRPCIRAGSRPGDLVCDPFLGSGTVAAVAIEEGRRWVGCDLDARNAALVTGRMDGRQVRMRGTL